MLPVVIEIARASSSYDPPLVFVSKESASGQALIATRPQPDEARRALRFSLEGALSFWRECTVFRATDRLVQNRKFHTANASHLQQACNRAYSGPCSGNDSSRFGTQETRDSLGALCHLGLAYVCSGLLANFVISISILDPSSVMPLSIPHIRVCGDGRLKMKKKIVDVCRRKRR